MYSSHFCPHLSGQVIPLFSFVSWRQSTPNIGGSEMNHLCRISDILSPVSIVFYFIALTYMMSDIVSIGQSDEMNLQALGYNSELT